MYECAYVYWDVSIPLFLVARDNKVITTATIDD